MQIAIALFVLLCCGGFLWWFKHDQNKSKLNANEEEERALEARATAQEFVNARDVGESCLYTCDDNIMAAIKLEGLSIELYSFAEQEIIKNNLSPRLSSIRYPYTQPLDNGAMLPTMAKNINTARGIELSTKDAIERQRAKKTADDQEKMIQEMDQRNESLGSFSTLIMVLSQNEQDFRDRCTRVVSLANSMGCRIRAIPNLQKEAYQHLCPTYAQNERINEITRRAFPISSFVGGFPFASSGFNDGTGFYLGKDSGGGIILLDLWKREKSRTNSNITIIGGTGTCTMSLQ